MQTEEWPLGSVSDRVDIALDGPDFAIFVEVKIDALEGPQQLQRYAELAKVKAAALGKEHGRVIFLSPRSPRELPANAAVITWSSIVKIMNVLPRRGLGNILARQFADHVRAFC